MQRLIRICCLAVMPFSSLFAQNNHPLQVTGDTDIGFRWAGDSIHGKWEPNAAMLVPVTLKGCRLRLWMQFDLGAPQSILYGNQLSAIRSSCSVDIPISDTIRDFSIISGKTTIVAPAIAVKRFGGGDSLIVGTIGADLLNGRIAVIDYPKRILRLLTSVPPELAQRIHLTDFVVAHNRILFPARINGRETLLFFDTGSSMFELIADRATCFRLAVAGAEARRFNVESWGRTLTANTLPANGNVELAGVSIPLRNVTFMEGTDSSQVAFMSRLGIGGMTGNKLFLRRTLVIDMLRRQFAIADL